MPLITSAKVSGQEYDVIVVGSGAAGGQTAYTRAIAPGGSIIHEVGGAVMGKGHIGIQGDHAGTLSIRGMRIRPLP